MSNRELNPSQRSPSRVAIIGGGIAGLTAAHTLRQSNPAISVELFESSDRLGGAIRTERIDGFLVEHGADMFATEPAAAIDLCNQLGIAEELITPLPTARGAAILCQNKLVRIPAGFVLMRPTRQWPMMRTPLLSPAGKLRLLAERFVSPRTGDADESVASFVSRRLGKETLERLVQPLVGGIYTGDVAKLSMAATMPQFWEMERRDGSLFAATRRRNRDGLDTTEQHSAGARYEKFRSFPGGMNRFIDALASEIDPQCLRLSTPVRQLDRNENGWHVTTHLQNVHGPFDHVIVATPAHVAAKLLTAILPAASLSLGQIRFASSAVIVLGVRQADLNCSLNIAGFVVPIRERRNFLAVSFTGDKFADRTPPGYRLLRVFIGGELQPELLDQSDDELVALTQAELSELIGLRSAPVLTKVIRWHQAMPQYYVGHLERLAAIEDACRTQPGLSLIGNSLHGVGIAPTIAHAKQIVRSIID